MDHEAKWIFLLTATIFLIVGAGVTISQYMDHQYRVRCAEARGQLIIMGHNSPVCQFPGK